MLHGTTPLLQYKILKNREKTQPIQYNKCSFYTVPYYSYLVNGKNKQRGRPPEKRPSPACLVFVGLVVVNLQIGSAGAADNGPGRRFAMLGLALNFRDRRLVIAGLRFRPIGPRHSLFGHGIASFHPTRLWAGYS